MNNQWAKWISDNNIPPQDLHLLKEAINSAVGQQNNIRIVRPTVQEKMVTKCGPYVDVNGLLPLYDKLIFRENLIVKGPKGDGKSLSLFHYAHTNKIPLIVVECSENHHKRDFVGSFYLQGMETPFILGDIPTAIDIANEVGWAILLFEEINGLTPQTQKQLNGLLDFRQRIGIPQVGRTYQLEGDARLWCVATMNPEVYGGTYELNEDLRSRFAECDIGYPPTNKEKEIIWANLELTASTTARNELEGIVGQIIKMANETRKAGGGYALSSRDLVRFIRNYQVLGLQQACQLLVCKFENDDRATAVERVTSHFKGTYVASTWGGKAVDSTAVDKFVAPAARLQKVKR